MGSFDMDNFASLPASESEWMLQWGDVPYDTGKDHVYAVQEAIENLDPQSRFCVEAIFYEGISYSTLGQRLGVSKPHAWRLARKAMAKLERQLLTNHSINLRYQMFDNWEDAANATVTEWDGTSGSQAAHRPHIEFYRTRLAKAVREQEETPRLLIIDLAYMAVNELRFRNQWNAEEMLALLVRKQRDYGHSNILEFGHVGLMIRLCDKLARLATLLESGAEPSNESLIDTWMDIVGYSVISEMLFMNTFVLNLKEE